MTGKSQIGQAQEAAIRVVTRMDENKLYYEKQVLEQVHTLVLTAHRMRSSYASNRPARERILAIHHSAFDLWEALSDLYNHWPIYLENINRIRVYTLAILRNMDEPDAEDITKISAVAVVKLKAFVPEKEYPEDELTESFSDMQGLRPQTQTDPTDQMD